MSEVINKTPLVSVIIPVYNSERYLDICLKSVCEQTYRNLEIVAVNDGSTDSSLKILEDWKKQDSRIKIINRENGGLSAARNTGIKASNGDILTFVDSDDLLWKSAIEKLLEAKNTCQVRIACGLMTSELSDLGSPRKGRDKEIMLYPAMKVTEGVLYQTTELVMGAWGQLFDRSLFTGNNLFWEGKYYEDLELMPRLYMSVSDIAILRRNVYYYRQHETSFVHTFSPKRFDSLEAVSSLTEHISPLSATLRRAVEDRTLSASFNAFLLSAGRKEFQGINTECWKTIKRLRKRSFFDRKVRLKNKIGILLSLPGRKFMALFHNS